MTIRRLIALGLVSIFLCIFSFWLCWYLYMPNVLEMEYMGYLTVEEEQRGTAWSMVKEADHGVITDYGIDITDFDFNENFLVISTGRPLKSIVYRRISKFLWPYSVYKGIATFKDQLNDNQIYLYRTEKISCHYDDLFSFTALIEKIASE